MYLSTYHSARSLPTLELQIFIKEDKTMKRFTGKLLLIFIVVFFFFFSAESWGESSTAQQIKELKQRLEEIQRQNQQQIEELQKKIEALETEKTAEQKKLEELKAEEKDAWWKKIEVSYKKPGDGFNLSTKDGLFSLRMRLRAQFQLRRVHL